MAQGQWSTLGRSDLVALGKNLVTERLEQSGCRVTQPTDRRDARLEARTPSGRRLEVFVSTQRVGGYVLWTKRRLQPAEHRYAAVVLLGDEPEPMLFVVPSTDWLHPAPPLTDRDYEGQASEPEYGIAIGPSSLSRLARYAWTDQTARRHFA